MQYCLLLVAAMLLLSQVRHINLMRRAGYFAAARRSIGLVGLWMGLIIVGAMLCQEIILLRCGKLTWKTGLPLHLCSMMGLAALPMLVTGNETLRNLSLYLGMPGALAALVFPAVLETPWPEITRLSFHIMHTGVLLCPVLPLCCGWRPRPRGALEAGVWLALAAAAVSVVNDALGSNYLFLRLPAAGTPLAWMAGKGLTAYRIRLFFAAAAVLALEGRLVGRVRRGRKRGRI